MILKYAPEGVDPRTWQFTLDTLMSVEAEAIERQTGWAYPAEFAQQLMKQSITARKSLLWVFLKRDEPTLRYQQVDPQAGAIVVDFERAELLEIRAQVDADDTISIPAKADALEKLDDLIAKEPGPDLPKAHGNVRALSG